MAFDGRGASRVEFREVAPVTRQIAGVRTSVVAVFGVTQRGPVGVPTYVYSFAEYLSIFGDDVASRQTTNFARGFFQEGNGAGILVVVRVVHHTDVDDASTKTSVAGELDLDTSASLPSAGTVLGTVSEPFELADGDTLVVAVDGGGPATATFNADYAARATAGDEPYALANGQTLTVAVNGGSVQTATFLTSEFVDIANATRAEVAAVLNAKLVGVSAVDTGTTVELRTDRKGTGATINVTGGTANAALGFTTGPLAGTGNVADISAVTLAEVETVVEAAVVGVDVTDGGGGKVRITSNTTGPTSSVQVQASSTADDELGLDNAVHSGSTGAAQATLTVQAKYDGAYAGDVTVRVSAASNGNADYFNFTVLEGGSVEVSLSNLTMDSASARYAPTVVADAATGSKLVVLEDLGLSGTATQRRPANGTFGPLVGGDDGLVGLADTDFLGSSVDESAPTGLHALDRLEDVSVIAVPDRTTLVAQQGVVDYCEARGGVFAVLDAPAGLTSAGIISYVEGGLQGSSEYGAVYWPWVKVANPDTAVYGSDTLIDVPPSGLICGAMARNDAVDFYQPAAGEERGRLRSARGLETEAVLDDARRGAVYDARVNPLHSKAGVGVYVDGTKTLKGGGNFPTTSQRRSVNFIETSLKLGLGFVRHSNNTPALRREVAETTRAFLLAQMRRGAFQSDVPELAFSVDFGDGLNTPDVVNAGILKGRIGLATNRTVDYVYIEVTQDTQALEASLA